jgi:hypothetical protein
MHGRGFGSFLSGANKFLKDNQIISKVASAIAPHLGESGASLVNKIGSVAGTLGYGRRRHRRMHHYGMGRRMHLGHGLHLGGALRLAGMR